MCREQQREEQAGSSKSVGGPETTVHRWLAPPAYLVLPKRELHVWRAQLARPASELHQLERTLSQDEHERLGRFRLARDRERFIVARGLLRSILGRYTGYLPAAISLAYGARGKPALIAPSETGLCFNLTHTGGLALYAIARECEVGIDAEYMRPDLASREIVDRYFSPAEIRVWQALPTSLRVPAFFACWTRKEAYLKALGDGLFLELSSFDVSLHPDDVPALLATRHDPTQLGRWHMYGIDPAPSHAAAVVIEGHVDAIRCWDI